MPLLKTDLDWAVPGSLAGRQADYWFGFVKDDCCDARGGGKLGLFLMIRPGVPRGRGWANCRIDMHTHLSTHTHTSKVKWCLVALRLRPVKAM
jgi:hypothetical protein